MTNNIELLNAVQKAGSRMDKSRVDKNLKKMVAPGNLVVTADPQSETWGATAMHTGMGLA